MCLFPQKEKKSLSWFWNFRVSPKVLLSPTHVLIQSAGLYLTPRWWKLNHRVHTTIILFIHISASRLGLITFNWRTERAPPHLPSSWFTSIGSSGVSDFGSVNRYMCLFDMREELVKPRLLIASPTQTPEEKQTAARAACWNVEWVLVCAHLLPCFSLRSLNALVHLLLHLAELHRCLVLGSETNDHLCVSQTLFTADSFWVPKQLSTSWGNYTSCHSTAMSCATFDMDLWAWLTVWWRAPGSPSLSSSVWSLCWN